MSHPRVLLVDDESHILSALSRSLRAHLRSRVPGLTLDVENDPWHAVQRFYEHQYDLVISDHRMPGITGVEVLSHLRQVQPYAGRVILSGQIDNESLRDAINVAHIHCYLTKPWNDAELADVVERTLAVCAARREEGEAVADRAFAATCDGFVPADGGTGEAP